MKNRIQIDGEWYVKETPYELDENFYDIISCRSLILEDSEVFFEAVVSEEPSGLDFSYIKFVDKKLNKKEDLWDNIDWVKKIHEGDPEENALFIKENRSEVVSSFKFLLNKMAELKWI